MVVTLRRPSQQRPPKTPRAGQIAWAIVGFIIAASFTSLWITNQSLRADVDRLESKAAVTPAAHPEAVTCEVRGAWHANTTTSLPVGKRHVLVHTPQNFTTTSYQPILMVYSGKGATAESIQLAFGLDTLPAIVVYPEPTVGTDGATAWQGAPYSSPADDVAFTSTILDELESQLCIDRTRIYATGFSNGGGFAALLSCKLPDRFAAFAVVAGAMYPASDHCRPSGPVSLLNIHGDNDPVVPYHGSQPRHLPDIDDWTTRRAMLDGCTHATNTDIGFNTVSTAWSGCREGSVLESLRIQGGGHAWGVIPNGELWQFLSRFSL